MTRPSDDQVEYRPAPGYERLFEVARDGTVRSVRTGRALKPQLGKTGYLVIASRIGGRTGRAICVKVHRLVALAWVPRDTDERHVVNHIDADKLNNHASNLQWVTSRENARHALRLGLMRPRHGEANHAARLTDDDVRAIRHRFPRDQPAIGLRDYAKALNVCHSTVLAVIRHNSWKHVITTQPKSKARREARQGL